MEFKVGDTVEYEGKIYSIEREVPLFGKKILYYDLGDLSPFLIRGKDLKRAVPNNELSRVLYPDYEVSPRNPDYLVPSGTGINDSGIGYLIPKMKWKI